MKTSCFASAAKLGSMRIARAMSVSGPAAITVTWWGWACTCLMRKLAANPWAGGVVGRPSSRWGSAGCWAGTLSIGPSPPQAPFHGILP